MSALTLTGLVHAEGEQQMVFQYLGSRTWFWKIRVAQGGHSLEWVVARIPGEPAGRFAVLQDVFR